MIDLDPDAPEPEEEEEQTFPWAILIGIIVVVAVLGAWLAHVKSRQTASNQAMDQQLSRDHTALEAERQKVVDLTAELDALKQKIATGQVPNRQAALEQYHNMVLEQHAQRDKVKALADQYNAEVEKFENKQ